MTTKESFACHEAERSPAVLVIVVPPSVFIGTAYESVKMPS